MHVQYTWIWPIWDAFSIAKKKGNTTISSNDSSIAHPRFTQSKTDVKAYPWNISPGHVRLSECITNAWWRGYSPPLTLTAGFLKPSRCSCLGHEYPRSLSRERSRKLRKSHAFHSNMTYVRFNLKIPENHHGSFWTIRHYQPFINHSMIHQQSKNMFDHH